MRCPHPKCFLYLLIVALLLVVFAIYFKLPKPGSLNISKSVSNKSSLVKVNDPKLVSSYSEDIKDSDKITKPSGGDSNFYVREYLENENLGIYTKKNSNTGRILSFIGIVKDIYVEDDNLYKLELYTENNSKPLYIKFILGNENYVLSLTKIGKSLPNSEVANINSSILNPPEFMQNYKDLLKNKIVSISIFIDVPVDQIEKNRSLIKEDSLPPSEKLEIESVISLYDLYYNNNLAFYDSFLNNTLSPNKIYKLSLVNNINLPLLD